MAAKPDGEVKAMDAAFNALSGLNQRRNGGY
jgi:hypothetical protein